MVLEAKGFLDSEIRTGSRSDAYQQLRNSCSKEWSSSIKASPSQMQLQVFKTVQQLPGCEGAMSEHLTEDGLFSMDIALLLPDGTKVAIEVDGPMHFMSNKPDVPTGATLLRNFLLESRGWRVVSIPVTQWDDVSRKGQEACIEYLRSVLRS